MKIYAKQVPPEYQESYIFNEDLEGLEIYGNRDFRGYTSELFDSLPNLLENLSCVWDNIRNGYYDNADWAEELAEMVPPQGRPEYTREERRTAWPGILRRYIDAASLTPALLCEALNLITGRAWDHCTLRGCCQGDWMNCIYDTALWDGDSLETIEAHYFNTGSEWIIHDDGTEPDGPEEINGFSLYCTGWNDDLIRQEIAAETGSSPAEVKLYKFTGYSRRAVYEEC